MCVNVVYDAHGDVYVANCHDPDDVWLRFAAEEWAAFLAEIGPEIDSPDPTAHHPTPTLNGAQAPSGDRARAVWARRHRRIRLRPPAEPAITPAPVRADVLADFFDLLDPRQGLATLAATFGRPR